MPSVLEVRSQFPALQSGFAFLENAGGSQLPNCVIDALVDFLRDSYVQTTAGYPASDRATEIALQAHSVCETMMGTNGQGKVILGSSTTALVFMLSEAFSRVLQAGDEIIISEANHEANAGAWERLSRFGAKIKYWKVNSQSGESSLEDLSHLLSNRTKIVAFPHTSNLLGNVADVKSIAALVHQFGGKVVVDGVAYASHGLMEVADWNVDFYLFSHYKVYGPHMATLYGKSSCLAELEGPNHFFVDKNDVPRKFELGSLNYEGCAMICALQNYLCFLANRSNFDRETVKLAAKTMGELEKPIRELFLEFLLSRDDIEIVGPSQELRVPTFSFLCKDKPSAYVAQAVNQCGIGIRNGHMYSHRLCQALKIDPDDGVVRVSAVHYNSVEEIERLVEVLNRVL